MGKVDKLRPDYLAYPRHPHQITANLWDPSSNSQAGCLNYPVHRWYFITEGLPVNFVRQHVRHTKGPVLDPFLGAGTVTVETKLAGVRATGVDVNPFMCFASQVKTRDYQEKEVSTALECILQADFKFHHVNGEPRELARLKRYYTASTFKKLQLLRTSIKAISDLALRRLFLLCFVDVAVKVSNMRRTPAPRYVGHPKGPCKVFREFRSKIERVLEDLRKVGRLDESQWSADIFRGDSRDLSFLREDYGLVVTSPPYCNNVDFIRHSQLELLWLGLAADGDDLGRLRHAAITSCEAMAHANKDEGRLPRRVEMIADKIQHRSNRRYHQVVRQYFVGMAANIDSTYNVLQRGGRALYVVGDSWLRGVHVPTHSILNSFALKSGFRKTKVRWLRKRLNGRPHKLALSEYVIEMTK